MMTCIVSIYTARRRLQETGNGSFVSVFTESRRSSLGEFRAERAIRDHEWEPETIFTMIECVLKC